MFVHNSNVFAMWVVFDAVEMFVSHRLSNDWARKGWVQEETKSDSLEESAVICLHISHKGKVEP